MNAAQALLREVQRDLNAWAALPDDLREAITEELERASTAPSTSWPGHRTDPATGEQVMRQLGLVRDPDEIRRLNAEIDAADEDD